MSRVTHLDEQGRPQMVDVGHKAHTQRVATAKGGIHLSPQAFEAALSGKGKKGDVLAVAQLAGIQGAKQTASIIPLCHNLPLESVQLNFEADKETSTIWCQATVKTTWQTGVEMEALTAVSSALLTVYDMLKAIDKEMVITNIQLLEKHGGASGSFVSTRVP